MIYIILRTLSCMIISFIIGENHAEITDPCNTQQASNADFKKFWDGQWWNLQAYYQLDDDVIQKFAKASALSCLQVQLMKSSENENWAKLRLRNDRSENGGIVTTELNLTTDGDKQLIIRMTAGNLIQAHVFSSLNNGSEYFCLVTCDARMKQPILKQIRCYGNTEESKKAIESTVNNTEVLRSPKKC